MTEKLQFFQYMTGYTPLAGASGGITAFLLALLRDHYKNNKYIEKFSLETFGALFTATFLTFLVGDLVNQEKHLLPIAFVVGFSWAGIIQAFRSWITRLVEAVLGVNKS